MSRAMPGNTSRRKGAAFRALLLATSFLAPLRPAHLLAQETELRGAVSESAITDDQKRKTSQLTLAEKRALAAQGNANGPTAAATPAYQPASVGAAPDDSGAPAATGSIFDQPTATDDPFADDPAPTPQRRPSTARERADAQDAAADDKAKAKKDAAAAEKADASAATGDGNAREPTVDAADRQPLDPGSERTGAVEGNKAKLDDDPFAATGIRVGSFVLKPTLEQGVTATSNADSSSGGSPAVLSETTLRLNAVSDWATNSAVIDGYGIVRKTISGDHVEDAQGHIDGTLNIDLDNELRAIAKLGYEAVPESASSPVVIEGTASQPLRQTVNGSLGLEKDVGKMRFGVAGSVEHDIYGDAKLSAGGVLSQKDRDSTLYALTLRGGYEISPAITPFAEIEVGRRLYDQRVDSSGYARSSNRLGARAGLDLDLGEKLSGEFSAGWIREGFDDDRLASVSGATVDADLKWSPERGTVVGLRGQTTVEGATTAGESGSILYSGRLSVEREIRADLTANALVGADWRDYSGTDGHDLTLGAEAGLTWWLNRYAGITTRVRTEKQTSNLPGRDYTANSVFLGLKVQR